MFREARSRGAKSRALNIGKKQQAASKLKWTNSKLVNNSNNYGLWYANNYSY